MNEQEIVKLKRNLTKSAKKAKVGWVRGMVGLTESDQGFFDVMTTPVKNELTGKQVMLGELISDALSLKAPLATLEKELGLDD